MRRYEEDMRQEMKKKKGGDEEMKRIKGYEDGQEKR